MVSQQSVRRSVNKSIVIGFSTTTTDGTSTEVVTAATIATVGAKTIREISLKLTGDDAYLGFGKTATKTPGHDIAIIFDNDDYGFFSLENCAYESLNVIRASSTDITVEGFVVVK